ncbi:hypothetical protein EJ04DRAFT_334864 [Polyplosphaeria fusca]|uniref:C2H2-type domain-containing protein n=1 Tax=Polyplosphaeria fusca TaxID=682080 RepID=A0A9P4V7G7_9PLEO|nr:hypothetical protein EJ04DRAFT_334864 [Polyplosphaeria fusca]
MTFGILQSPNPTSRSTSIDSITSTPPVSVSQLSSPLITHPGPHYPTPTRPRKRQQTESVEIIGHVLSNKKFRCSNKNCMNANFGRQADLRRHYEQRHERNRAEYFCPHSGCSRSHPTGGGKGRGFGTRKDKCEEHIRNVHKGEIDPGEAQQFQSDRS